MASKALIFSQPCQIIKEFDSTPEEEIKTDFGPAFFRICGSWTVICRNEYGGRYYLPHECRNEAHMAAFKALGLKEVLAIHSSGSLRPSLNPGMLMIPDDWISITSPPVTSLSGSRCHLVPSFSKNVRQKAIDAAWNAQLKFENGGIYWQSKGPRLETKAEIKVMSNFADIVGMGLADEANLAQEMGLEYGAVCSVDNYANGLGFTSLSDVSIHETFMKNSVAISKLLKYY